MSLTPLYFSNVKKYEKKYGNKTMIIYYYLNLYTGYYNYIVLFNRSLLLFKLYLSYYL